jgi:hypothetical protein
MRTPHARDFLIGLAQEHLDREMAPYLADPPRIQADIWERTGQEIPVELIEAYVHEGKVIINKPFWLDFIGNHVDGAARRIYDKGWWRIDAPEGVDFITSDIGIVKFRNRFFEDPVEVRIGWWNSGYHWVMPVSPNIALGIGPDLPHAVVTAERQWVEQVNRLIVDQARRFVYSREFKEWIPPVLGLPLA